MHLQQHDKVVFGLLHSFYLLSLKTATWHCSLKLSQGQHLPYSRSLSKEKQVYQKCKY